MGMNEQWYPNRTTCHKNWLNFLWSGITVDFSVKVNKMNRVAYNDGFGNN